MKVRDFFTLIIKLFGLYSMIIVLFNILPQTLSYMGGYGFDFVMLAMSLIISILAISLFIYLLFKASYLVNLLQLEKGFESDTFNLGQLSEATIIKIASILLGGITVIENLPRLISYTLFAVSSSNSDEVMMANEKFMWIASLVQIFVGLYLVFNYKTLVNLLKNRT